MRHFFLAVLVVGIAALASPRLTAQVDETQFFKKPTNAAEFWRAITLEINVGKYEFAADFIKQMVEYLDKAEMADKELLDIEAKQSMVPFLQLRNVERWSSNEKVDADTRKNVETLIERVSGALKRELSDPKRITRFANALIGPVEEAAFAQKEIRRSGAAAIPVLASILKGNPPAELREAIVDLLPKLDASTVPPIVALLDISDPTLKFELLDALRRRPDYTSLQARVETNIVPHLWYLTSPASKMPEALRKTAASMLAGQLEINPEKRVPEAELTALADHLYQHRGVYFDPNNVQIWRWDGDQLTMTPTNISGAEEYFGLRYLRWALALKPNFMPALSLFVSLSTDKAILRAGLDRPLAKANPVLYDLLVSSPYDVLADSLDRALRDNRSSVALGIVQILGDRAEREAAQASERNVQGTAATIRPSLLARALTYPDRRVQFAAADALLRIPGPAAQGVSSRIVDVLRGALSEEPPAVDAPSRPKVLLGDPERFRSEAFAVLLRRLGFDVELVHTGKDILRRVQRKPDVDLIVVDHRLPGPLLPDFLAQAHADVRVAALPLIVVASSERTATPQILTVLARLAVLIAIDGRDDLETLKLGGDAVYRQRVDVILRDRQDRLQKMAESAGLARNPELNTRVEYLTLVAHQSIFEKGDIKRRIDELRPLIKPDTIEPSANKNRIDVLLRQASGIESALPADRLALLEKTWIETLASLPPWAGTRDEVLENRLRFLTKTYRNVRVIPDVFTEGALRSELVGLLSDPKTAPFTDAEKRAYSLLAVEWLRKMAIGEVAGYDIRPAGRVLRQALAVEELAPAAVDAVAQLSSKEAQQDLANVLLAGGRPAPLRLKAGDALIRHLQLHGKVLAPTQIDLLVEQAAKEQNPDLQAKFQILEGILRPNAQQSGERFQRYQPGVSAVAPEKEKIKEEPKPKEPKTP